MLLPCCAAPRLSKKLTAKLVAIRVGPCGPCLGIGNQVAVYKKFALLAEDGIGHSAEPCHQESLGGHFERWLGDVNACKHCLLHDIGHP